MKHLKIFESEAWPIQEATPPATGAPKKESKESIRAKRLANFFNKHYKMNLPLDGNERSPEYQKVFIRFCQEYKITTYTCKKGDGFCRDEHAGSVTIKDDRAMWAKFDKIVKNLALSLLMKP